MTAAFVQDLGIGIGADAGDEERLAALLARIPFVSHLGARLARFGGGEAELRLSLRPQHLNSWGAAHGGLVMTLLDSAMGLAARSLESGANAPPREMVTVQMSAQFMLAGEGELVATARVAHRSFAMLFCEGNVHDRAGRMCAQAMAAFKGQTPAATRAEPAPAPLPALAPEAAFAPVPGTSPGSVAIHVPASLSAAAPARAIVAA